MVPTIQKEKAALFLKYHHDEEILVLLNSWETGSSSYVSSGSTQEKLSESIRRGNKYSEAGADCIFVLAYQMAMGQRNEDRL